MAILSVSEELVKLSPECLSILDEYFDSMYIWDEMIPGVTLYRVTKKDIVPEGNNEVEVLFKDEGGKVSIIGTTLREPRW